MGHDVNKGMETKLQEALILLVKIFTSLMATDGIDVPSLALRYTKPLK